MSSLQFRQVNAYQMSATLLILLAAICCSKLHAAHANQGSNEFFKSSSVASSCVSAQAVTVPARSDNECAFLCSENSGWKSFSFINGVCTLSDSWRCASPGAAELFRKPVCRGDSGARGFGYEQLVGDRCFWVFQQRQNGAVSFARNWTEYERGFGNSTAGEFWSGLLTLNSLTSPGNVTLRMEMKTLTGILYVAEWSNFTVDYASTNYTMQYTQYLTGNSNVSSDPLSRSKGMQFSTLDRDNDKTSYSCSTSFGNGGFWYNNCFIVSPNGLYSTTEQGNPAYMSVEYIYPGAPYSTMREMRMMLQLA